MPLRFGWGCWTFQTASHVHGIHLWEVEHLLRLWMGIWLLIHIVTSTDTSSDLWALAEIWPYASVQTMPLQGFRTFQTATPVHVIHIWGIWSPDQVVDGHMASLSHHYHHICFPRFWESWMKSNLMQVCKPCHYALVEAVEPFKLHPMSMPCIYERLFLRLWMGIWLHIHNLPPQTLPQICESWLKYLMQVCKQCYYALIEAVYPYNCIPCPCHTDMRGLSTFVGCGWAYGFTLKPLAPQMFPQICESWLQSYLIQVCKPCPYALVEAVEPFKLHPMSMWFIYERFEHLLRLWMVMLLCTHTITTIPWINLLKLKNCVREVVHSFLELSWYYCKTLGRLHRTHIFSCSHQSIYSRNQYFLHSACKGLLWNMEQIGLFACDLCVVGLSKHLLEYLTYFEEQKNHVESMILYTVSWKKSQALW